MRSNVFADWSRQGNNCHKTSLCLSCAGK